MARTNSTANLVTSTVAAGATPSYANAAGAGASNGNYFPLRPGMYTIVYIKNGSGSGITITVKANGAKVSGVAVPDLSYSVPGTDFIIPPLDPTFYADSSGNVNIDWSAVTTVTFAPVTYPAGFY